MMLSTLTGEYYDENDAIRLVNTKQCAFYWGVKGIKPLSIYPSKDIKTGENILVYMFSKSKTQEAYKEWIERRNKE